MISAQHVRIGVVGPSLLFGGAERWIYNLVRHSQDPRIHWACNLVTHPFVEPAMLQLLSRFIPTYAEGIWHFRGSEDPATLDEAFDTLLRQTDVILGWELEPATLDRIGDGNKRLINTLVRNAPHLSESIRPEHTLVAVSEEWRELRPELHSFIDIIPNGIELDRCAPLQPRWQVKQECGLPRDALVVGTLGRLAAEKNHAALARGVACLNEAWAGVIAGSLTPESVAVKRAIFDASGTRIKVLPPREDVGSYLAALDVFALTSRSEACPLGLLEAFAARLPVVSTPSRFLENLEEEFGALTVRISPDASGPEVAKAIETAKQLPQSLRERARDIVFVHFNIKRSTRRWESKLLEVATNRRNIDLHRGSPSPSVNTGGNEF